ncbi:MAG: hypothetical protein DHS20C20_08240 [Ardenticatenaceae bacterium]|nr:MAG: hypothetical protein DHS20C20_08240 [Ardenticatenaceae bacterium]
MALFFTAGTASSLPHPIPTISITSVQQGTSVTFQTYNYPAGQTFTVRMGKMGTLGVGGELVGTLESGAGGSMTASVDIPEGLKNEHQIAIRLDSNLGYYSYNWFYNNTAPAPSSGGTGGGSSSYIGIPTFTITAVSAGENVTIKTNNFPANMTFNVTMGKMYTRGIDGISVGTIESGEGGTMSATFDIPDALKDDGRIAIRAQTAHANPYFAYNWFYNASTDDGDNNDDDNNSSDNGSGHSSNNLYTGIPTFTVCKVTRDGEIEVLTKNFPTNQNFSVTMGPMYSRGIGGTVVGALESKDDSSARYTFTVPDNLKGFYRISMRAQTAHAHPFYAFNWFYNNTTSMDHCQ